MTKGIKRLARCCISNISKLVILWRSDVLYRIEGVDAVNRLLYNCSSSHVGELLVRHGAIIGSSQDLNSPLLIHNANGSYSNLRIGKECHLGKDVFLDLRDTITIENQVTISMRVTILTHIDVGHSPLEGDTIPTSQAPVLIKRGSYIGANTTILQGVTIGECAVVGAGAVVVNDIPAHSVAVGVPAKVVRQIETDKKKARKYIQ